MKPEKWSLLLLSGIRQVVFNHDFSCGAMMSIRCSIYVDIFGIFSSCKQRVDLCLIEYAKASVRAWKCSKNHKKLDKNSCNIIHTMII